MTQVERRRGRLRLAALGLPPEETPTDEAAQEAAHKAFYEAERARYVSLAENGLHMAPSHALYGMLVAAIKDAHGWDKLPDHWLPEHPTWPTT